MEREAFRYYYKALLANCMQHACCVVRPGRTFVRQMHDLISNSGHYTIHLNKGVKSDLQWEATFLYHHGMIEA